VNKIGQLGRSVNKFPGRSFALRSNFASASRIIPSLALQLEHLGISLPKHLRHHVIGDATSAQPGSEGVPQLGEREVRHAGSRTELLMYRFLRYPTLRCRVSRPTARELGFTVVQTTPTIASHRTLELDPSS
jgi:hypothetical protein